MSEVVDPVEKTEGEPTPNHGAERARDEIVAKVERSLASLDAGRGVPHTEVLAMIDARYPGRNR
jgi:predicted transcriptional regulator